MKFVEGSKIRTIRDLIKTAHETQEPSALLFIYISAYEL